MATINVRELDVMAESTWTFSEGVPQWSHGDFGYRATFDPFPAYSHNLDVVRHTAELVSVICPPIWDVDLFVADREETGRSNGFSNVTQAGHWDGDEWVHHEPTGLIVLSGKRIPPHPVLTRYLVAHEYGHNVEWMINRARGLDNLHHEGLALEYAALRGLDGPIHNGTGGRWHDSIHEIFACDFRILVCDVDRGFWPHPGIAHPDTVKGLNSWWTKTLNVLAEHSPKAAA